MKTWFFPFPIIYLLAVLVYSHADLPAIPIQGISERGDYDNQAAFLIPIESGYDYSCLLDGNRVASNQWIEVTNPDYHEVSVWRTNRLSGQVESRLAPFVIRASERGYTEFGIPPWTPYPVIQSATAEYAGVRLVGVIPQAYPAGIPVPFVGLLEHADGTAAWINGIADINNGAKATVQLRRGFGFALVPPISRPGSNTVAVLLGNLTINRPVLVEGNPLWQSVSGILNGMVRWPENARVHIVSDLEIATNATLEIGASSLIQISPRVNVRVYGQLVIRGGRENPVVMMPANAGQPWGGLIATNSSARIQMTGVIMTGGGGNPTYFLENFGYCHRKEQPLFVLQNGATANLTNCFVIDNPGQFGNGYYSFLTMDHCLVQRCLTGGEYLGGAVEIYHSALQEFPLDTEVFADLDEDGIYLTEGKHIIQDTVIGWLRDDAIDAGSGWVGSVTVTNCWFESCFHEAMAWSGSDRIANVYHSVVINCGQGLETGYSMGPNSPWVFADGLLCIGNQVGARFGDNYNWGYDGFMRVTNSLLLNNGRDAWGMNFQDWAYRTNRMDIRGNFLTAPNPYHLENAIWNPLADGWRLQSYIPGSSAGPVGIGFACRQPQLSITTLGQGVPVGLSSFSTNLVSVDFVMESRDRPRYTGRLDFYPGETLKVIHPGLTNYTGGEIVRFSLANAVAGEVTGWTYQYFVPSSSANQLRLYWLKSAAELTLAWPDTNAILEQAGSPDGPWINVSGARSPVIKTDGGSPVFFRLRR